MRQQEGDGGVRCVRWRGLGRGKAGFPRSVEIKGIQSEGKQMTPLRVPKPGALSVLVSSVQREKKRRERGRTDID